MKNSLIVTHIGGDKLTAAPFSMDGCYYASIYQILRQKFGDIPEIREYREAIKMTARRRSWISGIR